MAERECWVAVAHLNGDGRPDIVVFMIDHPTPGPNAGWYRIGWDVDADGAVTGGWSPWMKVPDWFRGENQDGDIAVADLDGDGRPEIVVVMVDNPPGQNGILSAWISLPAGPMHCLPALTRASQRRPWSAAPVQ